MKESPIFSLPLKAGVLTKLNGEEIHTNVCYKYNPFPSPHVSSSFPDTSEWIIRIKREPSLQTIKKEMMISKSLPNYPPICVIITSAGYITIQRFIEGKTLDKEEVIPNLLSIGRKLRIFHDSLKSLVSKVPNIFPSISQIYGGLSLENPLSSLEILENLSKNSSLPPELKQRIRSLKKGLTNYQIHERLTELLTKLSLEIVVCHNDLWHRNIVLGKDNEFYLIDFEFACLGPRIWDIAGDIVLNFESYDLTLINTIVKAYNGNNPVITEEEVSLIPYLSLLRIIGWINIVVNRAQNSQDSNEISQAIIFTQKKLRLAEQICEIIIKSIETQ